jgi:hypothetical protein
MKQNLRPTPDARIVTSRNAVKQVESHLAQVAAAGYYGRLELTLLDGFVDTVRIERTTRIERPRLAAA